MTLEANYLVASIFLYAAMIVVQAVFSNLEHNTGALLGARDQLEDQSTLVGRGKRANQNMVEALLLFVPLVLIAMHYERLNDTTALGAAIFFFARLAYAPLYWLGVPVLRTLAWAAGFVGTAMIAFQILPFTGASV